MTTTELFIECFQRLKNVIDMQQLAFKSIRTPKICRDAIENNNKPLLYFLVLANTECLFYEENGDFLPAEAVDELAYLLQHRANTLVDYAARLDRVKNKRPVADEIEYKHLIKMSQFKVSHDGCLRSRYYADLSAYCRDVVAQINDMLHLISEHRHS